MNPKYKFSLIVGETEKQVFPNYKDDISKDYKLESNQRFYRADLSGKMTFQKSDFDYINGQPFETEFKFKIKKQFSGKSLFINNIDSWQIDTIATTSIYNQNGVDVLGRQLIFGTLTSATGGSNGNVWGINVNTTTRTNGTIVTILFSIWSDRDMAQLTPGIYFANSNAVLHETNFTSLKAGWNSKFAKIRFTADAVANEMEFFLFNRDSAGNRTSMAGATIFVAKPIIIEQNINAYYDENYNIWIEYWNGKFTKTDCKFDVDNKTCEVQPDLLDDYVEVLAGLEKEYNLIKLAPEITPMLIQRRPLIQIYIPGDSVVSCFLGGDYWEQDADTVDNRTDLVNTYHFALCNLLKEIKVTVNGIPTAASGLYVGRMNTTDGGATFSGNMYSPDVSGYYLKVTQTKVGIYNWGACVYQLLRSSDNVVLFQYSQLNAPDNMDFTMTAQNGATGTATAEMATYPVFARYLLDVDTISGLTTYDIPADDIVENNRNYKKAIGYAIDVAYISGYYSNDPTEWGLADNGKYFTPPYSIYGQKFFPIARSTWRYASIWFGFYFMDEYIETEGRKTYQIRDNYPLSSVISVLLKEFAPGITHEPTADYSQFLYGTNNPITYGQFRLFITQKTNVTAGDYDRPAQKAPITLNDVLKMLRDCFRCYWYIEDGKLKIEHIEFFRNGGSYSGGQQIGIDLTTAENIRNGKKWGFNTSQYDFDKIDLAERYQFEWMDDVTQAFEGFPIEVLSKYVTAGKIENVSISNFTSDIDYMILNPGAISEDGFALFAAVVADALFDTDTGSYFGGGSATSGGYGDKKYRLKTLLNGKAGNLIGSLYADSGATIQIVFWDSSNNVINTQAQQTIGSGATSLNANVTIPANAFYVGFKSVSGAFSYSTYYLNIPGSWQLPFINRTVDGTDFSIQNGLVSFLYLIPNFYVYDLPATRVRINEQETYATGIDRKKKQTVNFPTIDDPDPIKLIKTALGSGWVEKISVNLHSRMNKIDLRYDTE